MKIRPRVRALAGGALLLVEVATATPVLAYDCYHLVATLPVKSAGAFWDYLAFDPAGGHLFVGHRKEGLQVFDMRAGTLVATLADTAGSNAATLMPEFDLGNSNNETGTITPFKLSTLSPAAPIKLGEEIDTSHYDAPTKRLLVNMASETDSSDVKVLEVPSLKVLATVKVPSGKLEGGVSGGRGLFYLAARDRNTLFTIDPVVARIIEERKVVGCEQANSIAMDVANKRIFVTCRGRANAVAPILAVLDAASGKVVFSGEIGRGTDTVVYDPVAKRIITTTGIDATMVVSNRSTLTTIVWKRQWAPAPACEASPTTRRPGRSTRSQPRAQLMRPKRSTPACRRSISTH